MLVKFIRQDSASWNYIHGQWPFAILMSSGSHRFRVIKGSSLKSTVKWAVTALMAVVVLFGIVYFSKDRSPVISLAFDGSLTAAQGMKPLESARTEYISHRKKKALKLTPGSIAKYDVRNLDLRRGTMEFWLKLDSVAPTIPIPFLSLSGKFSPNLGILLNNKTMEFLFRQDTDSPLTLLRTDQIVPAKGAWSFWSIRWEASERYEMYLDVYCDGKPVRLRNVEEAVQDRAFGIPDGLTVGIPHDARLREEVTVDLGDLALWSVFRNEKEIQASYEMQSKEILQGKVSIRSGDKKREPHRRHQQAAKMAASQ